MLTCSKCGKPYAPGERGWLGRVEGAVTSGRTDTPLKRVLLCPDDAATLIPAQRRAWHEYLGETRGPTREKRPGRLGEPGVAEAAEAGGPEPA